MTGYLEIFLGPMFAGKTSKLLELYKQYTFCTIPCIIINHILDKRYHNTLVSTHDKQMAPCIQSQTLSEVWHSNQLDKIEVILINEGQFFSDLHTIVIEMVQAGKKVYIVGLDGDFERKKFGTILDLIPFCDKVSKLTSLCSVCRNGTHAIFTKRLSSDRQQTVIGTDLYQPVCRSCYEQSE